MRLTILLFVLASFVCVASYAVPPTVDFKTTGGTPTCDATLDDLDDIIQVDAYITGVTDVHADARRFSWLIYAQFDDGIVRKQSYPQANSCMEAQEDSCCSQNCNGVVFRGSPREEEGWGTVAQYGYAGPLCDADSCGAACSGTTDGKFMEIWVQLDPDYWENYRPGTYYRYFRLLPDNINPNNQGVFSCCWDESPCVNDSYVDIHYSVGTDSIKVCVVVPQGGFSRPAPQEPWADLYEVDDLYLNIDFEDTIALFEKKKSGITWGKIKSMYE